MKYLVRNIRDVFQIHLLYFSFFYTIFHTFLANIIFWQNQDTTPFSL